MAINERRTGVIAPRSSSSFFRAVSSISVANSKMLIEQPSVFRNGLMVMNRRSMLPDM